MQITNGKNGNEIPQEVPKKLKFLFVSLESLSGDIAWALKREGHEVKAYIRNKEDADCYDGILDKVDKWHVHKDWADIIVFDDVGFGRVADKLRKEGKLIIGGSMYTDMLEMKRQFGQDEMKNAGMNILPHFDFDDIGKGIEFIKSNPGRYVFKPSKFIGPEQKDLLFLGHEEDGKDLIEVLENNKNAWSKKIKSFQLQKFASGVEIAVGAFFNGEDFIYPINVNFEHKRLFPGDIGPFTGEMGTLMYWAQPNKIFNATLAKMKDKLKESGYVGYMDINCIVNAKGIYPLEFTSRFGYPTIPIQMEGITMPMGEFFYRMVTKQKFEIKTKNGFQLGVVIAVPPFPYNDVRTYRTYKDSSIILGKPSMEGVHIGDVKMVNGVLTLAGTTGYALVITGSGSTVESARRQVYKRIANIIIPNMFYRTDIGERWFVDSDKLQTWGYLY